MGQAASFEWDEGEIRRVGYRVVDLIAEHLGSLPARPVFTPVPADAAGAMAHEEPPRAGASADAILDEFRARIEPYPFGNGHPRFYGWVNSPPAVISVLMESLAAAMNPSVAGGNHAAVHLERQVVHWFRTMLGLPSDAMGLLVSGGSAASIIGLAAARHVACRRLGWDVRARGLRDAPVRLTAYGSAEAHGCNRKAVEVLGIGSENLRTVPTDTALRMDPSALRRAIRADVEAGGVPFAVVASVGTVNTGAIDPIEEIADVCREFGAWLHVDGAYGAPAVLARETAWLRPALSRADSLGLDPHKWLYVPVEAGLVLVRSAEALRDALSLVPPYVRTDGDEHGVQGPPWFSEYGIQQTRGFRALKVWAALRYFGLDGYRELIESDIALARHLAECVRRDALFETWEPQGLGIVCFRAVPPALAGDDEAADALNRAVLTEVQLGGEAFLSGTVVAGRFWLRACIVNPRSTAADVEEVLEVVRQAVARRIGPPMGRPAPRSARGGRGR